MQWYHYVSGFWAGIFISNCIPHFVQGISGNQFPTPFAKPRGKGPSSPVLNVVWALFNLLIGYLLYRAGSVSFQNNLSLLIFFCGFAIMSILMSIRFAGKDKM